MGEAIYTCRVATIAEIFDLRHAELRTGMPRETARFEGDDGATTLHFGAFLHDGANIGCASFMLNSWEGEPAYRLRGMATRKDWVGRGVGAQLLEAGVETILRTTPIRLLWCNARTAAVGFYEKQGWRVVSGEFSVPTVGPHYRMTRRL